MDLTVTNLLHEVDLVLVMNWLQLVNPVVDWGGECLYIPNAVHTALLQGDWLEGHVLSNCLIQRTRAQISIGSEDAEANINFEDSQILDSYCWKFNFEDKIFKRAM